MKKLISILAILAFIASSSFALSAKACNNGLYDRKTVTVYDDYGNKVLVYERPIVPCWTKQSLGKLYTITWYKEGATTEQIKEWKEFAKLFVEEE